MATALERFYASGDEDQQFPTIELSCRSWPEPIIIFQGMTTNLQTEDGRLLTFLAGRSSIDPKQTTAETERRIRNRQRDRIRPAAYQ
ncbi:hypothetical protein [Pseudomonas aeruginosa]|uniref:hypothetical protein n=1 Tax=Pseudomonas aeruginosa TaxID=287 RepID=UPI001CEC6D75|nr:hypothetical protein [Pseudomonas aeruginosa]